MILSSRSLIVINITVVISYLCIALPEEEQFFEKYDDCIYSIYSMGYFKDKGYRNCLYSRFFPIPLNAVPNFNSIAAEYGMSHYSYFSKKGCALDRRSWCIINVPDDEVELCIGNQMVTVNNQPDNNKKPAFETKKVNYSEDYDEYIESFDSSFILNTNTEVLELTEFRMTPMYFCMKRECEDNLVKYGHFSLVDRAKNISRVTTFFNNERPSNYIPKKSSTEKDVKDDSSKRFKLNGFVDRFGIYIMGRNDAVPLENGSEWCGNEKHHTDLIQTLFIRSGVSKLFY